MQQMADMAMTPADCLKQPYARVLRPEADGSFSAEILEFPGCFAVGDTGSEALQNLENVAESWILGMLAKNERIPEPLQDREAPSGRFVLRLPRSLHKKAAITAEQEGVSLNQFISACVAEAVGLSAGRARDVKKENLSPISLPYSHATGAGSSKSMGGINSGSSTIAKVVNIREWVKPNQSDNDPAPRQSKGA
jgi:predicted RNase H-like HicB family nuclease